MKDSTLLKISIIFSISGIILLYFISENIVIEEMDSNIIEEYKDKTVKITGVVEQATKTESATFLKIKQPSTVDVVVFESLDIEKGSYMEVTGKVDEYNDEYEILADKIRVR
jgi:aspartyl/asparaginyl-tRNA synthetase